VPEIQTQVTGLPEVMRALNGLARVPNSDIHRVIASAIHSQTLLRFSEEKAADGTRWSKSRRVQAEGGQTLQDTRRLYASIIAKWSETYAKVGSNVVYAAIHQFGGEIVPRAAGALAIPVSDEARLYGYARRFPRTLHLVWRKGAAYGWLIEMTGEEGGGAEGTNLEAGESGAYADLERAGIVKHYLLRRSVTLPARPWLGLNAEDEAEILGRVCRLIRDHVQGGG